MQLQGWFLWFILFWVVFLAGSMGIGGFFMFRKFLKKMPKDDGKSDMDWEEYYVNESRHLWGDPEKALLEDLVILCLNFFEMWLGIKLLVKLASLLSKKMFQPLPKN